MAMKSRPLDLSALLASWLLSLRAERKSPQTVKSTGTGFAAVPSLVRHTGVPADLSIASVSGFVAALLDGGAQPTTARARQLAVRRFTSWLAEGG